MEVMEVAGEVVTTVEELIVIVATTAMTMGIITLTAATGVATMATVKFSRLAVTIRIKGMIPPMIEPWSHTMEGSQQTNSSVLRKDVEGRPEEALAEVCTDKEDEEEEVRKDASKERQVLALVNSETVKGIPETLKRKRQEN